MTDHFPDRSTEIEGTLDAGGEQPVDVLEGRQTQGFVLDGFHLQLNERRVLHVEHVWG